MINLFDTRCALEDNIHFIRAQQHSTIINLEHPTRDIILNINEDPQTQDKSFSYIAITGAVNESADKNHNYDTFREALVRLCITKVEFGLSLLNDYLSQKKKTTYTHLKP